jgi:NAD+-dependent protein deacetylase sirtuin 5
VEDLPQCPSCKKSLLRPAVVWFGEPLDEAMLQEVDKWISKGKVDLMLVVGTAAVVQPAAGYIKKAKHNGALVVVINPDEGASRGLGKNDFFFQDTAGAILPTLLEPVIGKNYGVNDLAG